MTDEKPRVTALDVKVSEALGRPPAPYSTSWCLAGPLIAKHGIALTPDDSGGWIAVHGSTAAPWGEDEAWGHDTALGPAAQAPTPLLAVCNLIVALKAAGKLNP